MKKLGFFLGIFFVLSTLNAQQDVPYSFDTVNLIGSGTDSGKVIIPIVGDGYTEAEQEDFVAHAKMLADDMVGFYPFDYFNAQNKLIVKAIKVVSGVSGASEESFFHSTKNGTYLDATAAGWQKYTVLMNQYAPTYAAAILLQNYDKNDVGPFAWSHRKAVVQTSFHKNSATLHELGHALANLKEEYDYQNYNSNVREDVNLTRNPDLQTNRWKNFVGLGDVGAYKHVFTVDDAPDWYRPSNGCIMRNHSTFCPVCAAAMVEKMAASAGMPFYGSSYVTTTPTAEFPNRQPNMATSISYPSGYGLILDYAFHGCNLLKTLTIPADVTAVGNYAFLRCTGLKEITNHATTPQPIDADKVFFGVARSAVTLHVPAGTTMAYEAAGWTNFKIVEGDQPFTGYYVAFHPNGGQGDMPRMIFFKDSVRALRTNTFIRTGWLFKGWAASENGEVVYQDRQEVNNLTSTVEEVVTLYAVWERGVSVSFDLNYASTGNPPATQTLAVGELASRPTDPTRQTYNFIGWHTETEGENLWDFNAPVASDLTLYAKWTGTSSTKTDITGAELVIYVAQWHYGSAKPTPAYIGAFPMGRSDYTLSYEYDWKNCKLTVVITPLPESNYTGRATKVLPIAGCPEDCIVTFNSQGGTEIEPQHVDFYEKIVRPEDPTRTGFTFEGWYKEVLCTTPWIFLVDTITMDLHTLYAKWSPNAYTVTFNSQGGSEVSPQTIVHAEKIARPEEPTYAGFLFEGWFKDSICTKGWDFETDTVIENLTLYAKWAIDASVGDIFDTDISVFPNPFFDVLHLAKAEGYALQILNLNGHIVHRQKIVNSPEIIQIQHLPSGIYFLLLNKNNDLKTMKIIKLSR